MSTFTFDTTIQQRIDARLNVSLPGVGQNVPNWLKDSLRAGLEFGLTLVFLSPCLLPFLLALVAKSEWSWGSAIGFIFFLLFFSVLLLYWLVWFSNAATRFVSHFFGEWSLSQAGCQKAVKLTQKHEENKWFVGKVLSSGRNIRVADFILMNDIAEQKDKQKSPDWCKQLHCVETA
jgi:hypothetical protein